MELFDRQKQAVGQGEKTLLVFVKEINTQDNSKSEFIELAKSSGLRIAETIQFNINTPKANFFIGSGKVEQISQMVADLKLDLVIFSTDLSPSQERNLEKKFECQVMDRTGLILDIFALRAVSFEGKLQVELAQLKHLSTRLVKGWSHLERQKGGIGLRGPGETQLETDKRLIAVRIKNITKRLEKVHKQRDLGRKSRSKNDIPMIALAGYTNAGKSSLFNALTKAQVFAHDQLFATLDSTIRKVMLPASGEAVIADTVGFIQNLPHDLIESFKSTLEESRNADILLHIVDSSDEHNLDKIHQVEEILTEIGAKNTPSILIMNKIDCLNDFSPRIDRNEKGEIYRIWLSAKTGYGIEFLYQALSERLSGIMQTATIKLDVKSAYIRSEIYNVGYIKSEKMDDFGSWILEIRVTKHYLLRLLQKKGLSLCQQK